MGLVLLWGAGGLSAEQGTDWEAGFAMLQELGMPHVEGAELGLWRGRGLGFHDQWSRVTGLIQDSHWGRFPVWRWEEETRWHFYSGGVAWSVEKEGSSVPWEKVESLPEDFHAEFLSMLRQRVNLRGYAFLLGVQMYLNGWDEGLSLVKGLEEDYSLPMIVEQAIPLLPEGRYYGILRKYVLTRDAAGLVAQLERLEEDWGENWFAAPWLRKVLEDARTTRDWQEQQEDPPEGLPDLLFYVERDTQLYRSLSWLRKTFGEDPERVPEVLRPLAENPMETMARLLDYWDDRRFMPLTNRFGRSGQISEEIEWAEFPRPDSLGWVLRAMLLQSLPREFQEPLENDFSDEEVWAEAMAWAREIFQEKGDWEEYLWTLLEGDQIRDHRVVLELLLRESEAFDRERFEEAWPQPLDRNRARPWDELKWSTFATVYIQAFPDEQTVRWMGGVEYPTDPDSETFVETEKHIEKALLAYIEEPTVERLVTELLAELEAGEGEVIEDPWLSFFSIAEVLRDWPAQEVLDVLVERLVYEMDRKATLAAERVAQVINLILIRDVDVRDYDFTPQQGAWEKVIQEAERKTYLADIPQHLLEQKGFREVFTRGEWLLLRNGRLMRRASIAEALKLVRASPGEDPDLDLPETESLEPLEDLQERLRKKIADGESELSHRLENFSLSERLVLMREFSPEPEEFWAPLGRTLAKVSVPQGMERPDSLDGNFLPGDLPFRMLRDKRERMESGSFGSQFLTRVPLLENFEWQKYEAYSAEDIGDSPPKLFLSLFSRPLWHDGDDASVSFSLSGFETLEKDFTREDWEEFLEKQNRTQEWEELLRLYGKWVAGNPSEINHFLLVRIFYHP